jgi:hypothetical protein
MDRQQKRERSVVDGGRQMMVRSCLCSVECADIIPVLFQDVFENGI